MTVCAPPQVRTLCSWCPAVIVDVPASDGRVSHGICGPCALAFFPLPVANEAAA